MKKMFALLAILLLIAIPVMSQDETAVPTDEVSVTQDDTPTEEIAQVTEEAPVATQEVVIIITPTPEFSPTPEPEATQIVIVIDTGGGDGTGAGGDVPRAGMDPNLVFVGIVLLSLIYGLADRFTNYKLSKDLAKAIPPEWMPTIEMGVNTARRIVYERAGSFADSTESPMDNNLLDEDMKRAGWEFYIDPATGERHARKHLEAAPGTVAG